MLVVPTHTGFCLLRTKKGRFSPPEVSPAGQRGSWRLGRLLVRAGERQLSFTLCFGPGWMKDKNSSTPSLSPSLSQFTAVKTYLKVGVDIPPAERRLSQSGLLWPHSSSDSSGRQNKADNLWISVTVTHRIHSRRPHIEQFWEKHNSWGCLSGLNSAQNAWKKDFRVIFFGGGAKCAECWKNQNVWARFLKFFFFNTVPRKTLLKHSSDTHLSVFLPTHSL